MACKVEQNDSNDEVAEKVLDEVPIHPVREDEQAITHREDARFVESF